MLTSLAYIFLFGLVAAALCSLIRIPRIIGILFVGILLGPNGLNMLDASILMISADLRQMALIIILIKAGLSFNPKDLIKVGRPAILMSFVPACFEILAFVLFAPKLLNVSVTEAAIIGSVLGAVSPAVVVPKMVQLIEEKRGTSKKIPQMILAGASLDDVFVIVLFSSFIAIEQGTGISVISFASIPLKIILGILVGILAGFVLSIVFNTMFTHNHKIRNSLKVVIMLGTSFILIAVETWLEDYVPVSGLLAVMSMACTVRVKCPSTVSSLLSVKFGRLWLAAELVLFVLVGASVDIQYSLHSGWSVIIMLFIGLIMRSVGTAFCLIGTQLNLKERLFCVISYIPKATVQAAIGGVPLALGLNCGNIVLTVAVASIIITAPLGALAIDLTSKSLLIPES